MAAGPEVGGAEVKRRDDSRGDMSEWEQGGGVKSESNRLVQSKRGGGGRVITLSWPPHTVTAGTGQQSCREERTGPRLR